MKKMVVCIFIFMLLITIIFPVSTLADANALIKVNKRIYEKNEISIFKEKKVLGDQVAVKEYSRYNFR